MKPISVSVKCTREEYMDFCVNRHPSMLWLSGIGLVVLAMGAMLVVMDGGISQSSLLLLFGGVIVMLLSPLILPMLRKGEAARRYDASDTLKTAMTLIFDDTAVTVNSMALEGTLPYDALTDVIQTNAMLAFVFGKECQLCIPKRVLTEDELETLSAIIDRLLKD